MTHGEAQAVLRGLAAALAEPGPDEAARRLLERISGREDAEELRAALVERGALALVQERGFAGSWPAPGLERRNGPDRPPRFIGRGGS